MVSSSVALDVDDTLTTADPSVLFDLKRVLGDVPTYINTARDVRYCASPSPLTTFFSDPERHLCRPFRGDPVSHKVKNMRRMQEETGVPSSCCILVDDRPENVFAVRKEGYSGILVDGRKGITRDTLEEIRSSILRCGEGSKNAISSLS